MPAISPNSLIVVTGITGYVASHVGLIALKEGHRVRGTVRSLDKAEKLKAAYTQQGADVSKLEFVVADLANPTDLGAAFNGADAIAHVALVGSFASVEEMPKLTIQAMTRVLEAAASVPSIKRFVFTSSSVAVIQPPDFRDYALTDKDWNDVVVQKHEHATEVDKKDPGWMWVCYAATKVLSEKAAWKWVEENKPTFEVVSILPNANFGPILYGEPGSTIRWIHSLTKGDPSITDSIYPQWFVDVRDDARLHVLALTTPSLGGKRIWAVSEPFGWNKILATIRKHFPHLKVPADISGPRGEPDSQKIDNTVATQVLGSWIGLEQSIVDSVKSFGL